jgi:hypothetical protein
MVTVSGNLKAPVALGLGVGNIAQPTFARLKLGTDKMFINGLILPLPPLPPPSGPFLGGHIDVETDGPNSGLLKGGSVAPNSVSKHSEGYNVETSDGLGGAVDGHVHAYDTIHGVYWVDLFQLEPRRGLANLEAVVTDAAADGSCDTTTNNKQIAVGTNKCIDAVEGELNRVYDTLQTDANGVAEGSMESEIYGLGSSTPLDPNQKFIVVLANADRSNSGVLQIGCRTWPVVAYENMITSQLETPTAPSDLTDTSHGNTKDLVFTLAGIYGSNPATCPSAAEAKAQGLSTTPTLRIGFSLGNQSIYKQGIHGTRSACVLGLHDYQDPVCYSDRATLSSAYAAVNAYHATPTPTLTPADYSCSTSTVPDPNLDAPLDYVRDPAKNLHITRLPTTEGSGYRWRNGALTVQLLKVDNTTGNAAYALEPVDNGLSGNNKINYLPRDKKGNRIGGTIAKAFTVAAGSPRDIVTANSTTKSATFPESGLLYEATMFWHYSDLADELRRAPPASIPCYGDSSYSSAVNQEAGLNYGDYQALTKDISDLIDQYAALLKALQTAQATGDENAINQALLDLGQLLADNPALAQYDKYRDYAPGHVPEQKLLDIDKGQLEDGGGDNSSTYDGTPADVTTIETIDLEAKGPNYSYGRRNWIDIRQ